MTTTEPTITAWLQAIDGGLRDEGEQLHLALDEAMTTAVAMIPRLQAFAASVDDVAKRRRAELVAVIGEESEHDIDDGLSALIRSLTGFNSLFEHLAAYADAIHPENALVAEPRTVERED